MTCKNCNHRINVFISPPLCGKCLYENRKGRAK